MPLYNSATGDPFFYSVAEQRRYMADKERKKEEEKAKAFAPIDPYMKLAQQANQFMTQQAAAPFISNLPDYQGMVGQRSTNIGSQLRGEVPQDVQRLLSQAGAERGVATGMGAGSPNANAAWLRALGLTSIGQQQLGQQGLTQAIADTPIPEIWNPMSLYVPERIAQLELAAAKSMAKPIQIARGVTFTPNQNYGQQQAASAWQEALKFSAENEAKRNAQSANQLKAYNDYWAGRSSLGQRSPTIAPTTPGTGTGTLTAQNPFGGFPQFGGMGLY